MTRPISSWVIGFSSGGGTPLPTEQVDPAIPADRQYSSYPALIRHKRPTWRRDEATATNVADREGESARAPGKKRIREGNKKEIILALMRQQGGTTLAAMMEVTSWQAHSVRGFVSGTLGKKMGLAVVSVRGENGERMYSVKD